MSRRRPRVAFLAVVLGLVCGAAGAVLGMYAAANDDFRLGAASGSFCMFAIPCFVTAVVAAASSRRESRDRAGFDVIVKGDRR